MAGWNFYKIKDLVNKQVCILKNYYDKADGVFKIYNEIDTSNIFKTTRGV